jgi:DNA-binding NarL/FixJ family response regulator
LTLVLADQHLLFRQTLRHYLEAEPGIRVIGETGDAFTLVSLVELRQPDVVLVDAALPGVELASTIRRVKATCSRPRVIVLSMGTEPDTFLTAVRAGADGFLVKDIPASEVMEAIRRVAFGGAAVSPELTAVLLREFRRLSVLQEGAPPAGLTEREIQLLRLVAAGLSNKEVAEALRLAESTVKNRLSLLFEKLGVKDRTQAAIYALTHGLLPESDTEYLPGLVDTTVATDQVSLQEIG